MRKDTDFINDSICKSHYLSSGWRYVPSDSYDIFFGNAFFYLCVSLGGGEFSVTPPFRVDKKYFISKIKTFEESGCHEFNASECTFPFDENGVCKGVDFIIEHIGFVFCSSDSFLKNQIRAAVFNDSNSHLMLMFERGDNLGSFQFFLNVVSDGARSGVLLSLDDVKSELIKIDFLKNKRVV